MLDNHHVHGPHLAGAAGLGLLLAVSGCATTGRQISARPQATTPSATTPAPSASTTSAPSGAGTWRMMPPAPRPDYYGTGVWTGTELLLHAPDLSDVDNARGSVDAAYDPVTSTWRRLPSSGLPVRNVEGGNRTVWTGTEMLAFGMSDVAYNPTTNRWRPLAPSQAGPSVTVWTGRQVLMWGGGCCGSENDYGSVYDLARNTWTPMPQGPLTGRHANGVWTGTELVIVGGRGEDSALADGAAYNPTTKSWRRLPSLPVPVADASITWTGTEVLVAGGLSFTTTQATSVARAMAYNPVTDTWRRLADMPVPRSRHMAVWAGDRLLVWGGERVSGPSMTVTTPPHGVAYDPVADRWTPMPAAPLSGRYGAVCVWTGSAMLVWGGYPVTSGNTVNGAVFTPARG